ncbi:MAG: hypothetical protein EON88_05495 [Brevundimonas sp.]|nr:MAG: hypothetical protein EON88_05495 [Brevundimonas sp.]
MQQYQIQLERPTGGLDIEPIDPTDARTAYDHCVERLAKEPEVTAIHLHLGQTRIHTIRRR